MLALCLSSARCWCLRGGGGWGWGRGGWLEHGTSLKIDIRSLYKRRLTKEWEGMKEHEGARECDRHGERQRRRGRPKKLPLCQTSAQRKQTDAPLRDQDEDWEGNEYFRWGEKKKVLQGSKWGQISCGGDLHLLPDSELQPLKVWGDAEQTLLYPTDQQEATDHQRVGVIGPTGRKKKLLLPYHDKEGETHSMIH